MDIRLIALELLEDCFQDEINMLKLRMIRDNQQPRFEKLSKDYPEVLKEFLDARNVHTELKANRDKRVTALKQIIESELK